MKEFQNLNKTTKK